MSETKASIGQIKRDISELVNRVAYGGERIVLTSRGKPKAVLISLEDYEILEAAQQETNQKEWESWLAQCGQLRDEILARRGGEPIDEDTLWQAVKAEQEERIDRILGY